MKKITLFAAMLCLMQIGYAQIITTIAGNGTAALSGDGNAATAAEINGPLAIVFDGMAANISMCLETPRG